MNTPDRLPLLKQAFRMLTNQLRDQDNVAIVTYAGSAGLVLPPTSGRSKERILAAIDRLRPEAPVFNSPITRRKSTSRQQQTTASSSPPTAISMSE
jgi:secreted protein with Ig-like and vWFA domain